MYDNVCSRHFTPDDYTDISFITKCFAFLVFIASFNRERVSKPVRKPTLKPDAVPSENHRHLEKLEESPSTSSLDATPKSRTAYQKRERRRVCLILI